MYLLGQNVELDITCLSLQLEIY